MAQTPTMGSAFQQGSWKTLQPHSLLIRFNDLILIALRIYLLVRRKTTTSQGLPAGVLKTGLLGETPFPAPCQGLRALMRECGLQAGWGCLKGQGPGKGVVAPQVLNKPAGAGTWLRGNIIWCDSLFPRHHLPFLRPTESPSCKRHTLQIRVP